RLSLDAGVTLTIASSISIRGQNGQIGTAQIASPTGTLINQGTIQADVSGGTLFVTAPTTNDDLLQALSGATLSLNAAIDGNGTITTDTGNGSQIAQTGITITGNTIGGELVTTNDNANILSGVTVSSSGVVDLSGTRERITSGLTLDG